MKGGWTRGEWDTLDQNDWRVDGEGSFTWQAVGVQDEVVVLVVSPGIDSRADARLDANVSLIKAAPALYDALETATRLAKRYFEKYLEEAGWESELEEKWPTELEDAAVLIREFLPLQLAKARGE